LPLRVVQRIEEVGDVHGRGGKIGDIHRLRNRQGGERRRRRALM